MLYIIQPIMGKRITPAMGMSPYLYATNLLLWISFSDVFSSLDFFVRCRSMYGYLYMFHFFIPVFFNVHWCFLLYFTDIYKNNSKFYFFIYLSCSFDHIVQQCPSDDIAYDNGFTFLVLVFLSLLSFMIPTDSIDSNFKSTTMNII
jgi:hypothetical protein